MDISRRDVACGMAEQGGDGQFCDAQIAGRPEPNEWRDVCGVTPARLARAISRLNPCGRPPKGRPRPRMAGNSRRSQADRTRIGKSAGLIGLLSSWSSGSAHLVGLARHAARRVMLDNSLAHSKSGDGADGSGRCVSSAGADHTF
jgi:hypothetical protein